MSFRTVPETTEEHLAYIYELLRRLRPHTHPTVIIDDEGVIVPDNCPCIVHIRTCTASESQPLSDYEDEILALNPVGYWRLDETSGTVATDLSSNANHGTYEDNYVLGETPLMIQSGTSVYFNRWVVDGDTTRVLVPALSAYEIPTNFSVAFWWKLDSVGFNIPAPLGSGRSPVWMPGPNGAGRGWAWSFEGNIDNPYRHAFALGIGGTVVSAYSPTMFQTDTVYFTVLTYDGVNMRIWTDGALDLEQAQTGNVQYTSPPKFAIGAWTVNNDSAYNWPGWVDEVAIFDTVLTQSQIEQLHLIGTS